MSNTNADVVRYEATDAVISAGGIIKKQTGYANDTYLLIHRFNDDTYKKYNPNDGNVTHSGLMSIRKTTQQFKLEYDGSNSAGFTVNSSGNITITPTGGTITLDGSVSVNSLLTANSDLFVDNFLATDSQTVELSADDTLVSVASSLLFIGRSGGDPTAPTERTFGITAGTYNGQRLRIVSSSSYSGQFELDDTVGSSATLVPSTAITFSAIGDMVDLVWDQTNSCWYAQKI